LPGQRKYGPFGRPAAQSLWSEIAWEWGAHSDFLPPNPFLALKTAKFFRNSRLAAFQPGSNFGIRNIGTPWSGRPEQWFYR
jgi:hypothetical protein